MSTPNKDDPGLEKLREEYFKQLLDRYEARSKTLRSLLFGFVGFGSMFLLLVVIPFAGLRRQHHDVTAQLDELNGQAKELGTSLEAYGKATEGFKKLQSAIDNGPGELRNALPALVSSASADSNAVQLNAQVVQQMVQQQIPNAATIHPQGPCGAEPNQEARINCLVAENVRLQFTHYSDVLENEIIQPVEALPAGAGGTEGRPDSEKLRTGLKSIQAKFEERLKQTPRFWELFEGKIDFFTKLKLDLEDYWKELGFESQRNALAMASRKIDKATSELKARQSDLDVQEKGLAARLAQIETPLGKLPIGLIEGIQIFPLLMTIGFGWCWAVLFDLVALRRALRESYRQRDPNRSVLTDRQISLIAPLWIDAQNSAAQATIARATLFAPVVIFGFGCMLVFYLWFGRTKAIDASSQDRWLYGALYFLSTLVLVIASKGVLALVREIRAE